MWVFDTIGRLVRFVGIGGAMAVALGSGPVQAGELDRRIIDELLESSGWKPLGAEPDVGLTMLEKSLSTVALTAYMGVQDVPAGVDVERLWKVIVEVDHHERIGGQLLESEVFRRHGSGVDSFQVLKPPTLMPSAQRYWLLHSEVERDVDGLKGHRRRCWSNLAPDEAPEIRDRLVKQYPNASGISLTHGCWEILPGTPSRLVYRTVSDPGSALARTAVGMLTTRTLPENLGNFLSAARE